MELIGVGRLGDQINAHVPTVFTLQLGPLGIGPDIAVKVAVGCLVAQIFVDGMTGPCAVLETRLAEDGVIRSA